MPARPRSARQRRVQGPIDLPHSPFAEHMKLMQEGMAMMEGMGPGAMGGMGMGGMRGAGPAGAAGAPMDMATRQQTMERRMEMMQSMMQMMMDRMGAPPART